MSRPQPITGVSAINCLGATLDETREALRTGRSGLGTCPIELPFEVLVGAIGSPLPELPRALAPWSTRTAQIAQAMILELEAPLQTMRARWRPERIAVLLGTSTAGADVTENAYREFLEQGALPHDYDLFRQHTYGAILHVMCELVGAKGPAWVASTACTSSAKPFATARRLIEADVIDAAVVGGIDTLCGMTLQGFRSLDALSKTRCRPFAADRDGLNIGEGGALLLIEREGDARALLEGVGESSDAYHISGPHPEGDGARLAMERALADAGLDAMAVDHVNAHGTGTRLNDAAESLAITSVLSHAPPVVSTKAYTGHLLGGAGATEAAIAMLAITEGWIPASLGALPLDESIEARVVAERMDGRFRHVLSNSFAFGGNNVSVLLGAAR